MEIISFIYLSFFSLPFTNHTTTVEWEGISLTPHDNFHLLHRYLDINREVAAGSSTLHTG